MGCFIRKVVSLCTLLLCVMCIFGQTSRQLVMEEDAEVNSLPRLMLDEFYVHEGIRLEAIDDTGDYLLLCYDDSDSGNIYEEFIWSRRDKKVIKHYYNPFDDALGDISVGYYSYNNGLFEYSNEDKILKDNGETFYLQINPSTQLYFSLKNKNYKKIIDKDGKRIIFIDTDTKEEWYLPLSSDIDLDRSCALQSCCSEKYVYYAFDYDGLIKKFNYAGEIVLTIPIKDWDNRINAFQSIYTKNNILYVIYMQGGLDSETADAYKILLYNEITGEEMAAHYIPLKGFDAEMMRDCTCIWDWDCPESVYIGQDFLICKCLYGFGKYDSNLQKFSYYQIYNDFPTLNCFRSFLGIDNVLYGVFEVMDWDGKLHVDIVNLQTLEFMARFTCNEEHIEVVSKYENYYLIMIENGYSGFENEELNKITKTIVIDTISGIVSEWSWNFEVENVFPLGDKLVANSFDNKCFIYDLITKKKIITIDNVNGIAGNFLLNLLYIKENDSLTVYDIQNLQKLKVFYSSSDFDESEYYIVSRYNSGYEFGCVNIFDGTNICKTKVFSSSEYLSYTIEGFFSGSEKICRELLYFVNGLDVIALPQIYDFFYRPDLIAAKVRGEDISEEVAKINLASLLNTGRPPVVTFTNIPKESSERNLKLELRVKDEGGGIGAVSVVLNGQVVKISDGMNSSKGETKVIRHTVTLQPGENKIQAFAYNSEGAIESLRTEASVTWQGKTEKPNLYVLTVGVNKYRDKSLWLNYAVPDAESIGQEFQSQTSKLYGNVYVKSLLNADVTKEGISNAFRELSTRITADDVFVFLCLRAWHDLR